MCSCCLEKRVLVSVVSLCFSGGYYHASVLLSYKVSFHNSYFFDADQETSYFYRSESESLRTKGFVHQALLASEAVLFVND